MNVETALKLAESGKNRQAIYFCGVHLVTSRKAAEKLDARGVCFSYTHRHTDGKIYFIPNRND